MKLEFPTYELWETHSNRHMHGTRQTAALPTKAEVGLIPFEKLGAIN